MSDDLVNITIDGHSLAVPKGTLLVEAARQLGIEIPVYCYHPKMKPVGACRVCVVEVEKQRRPIMTACTTTVMPDMVVHTQSENAIAAREGVIEFLLINHPLDCPVCDRAGECDLQDFTLRYGPGNTRFIEEKRHFEKSKQVGKNVILDRERCIMCQRCVRFCDEIAMEEGLVIIERGNRSEIGTFEGRSFDSKFSGNVIELCPVGALTAKTYRFESRPWEQQHFAGISNVSSIGANITIDVRFDKVVRIRSRMNDQIDDGWLTDNCRYSHLPIHSEDRVLKPLMKNEQGEQEEVSWETALTKLKEEFSKDGVTSGIACGSRLSIEDAHMLLKLGRSILETPHVTHEFAHERLETGEPLTGRVVGCDEADVIICLGCDPTESHPAFELRMKKGLRHKAKLIALTEAEAMRGLADFQISGEPSSLWTKLLKALKKKKKSEEAALKFPAPRPWEAGGSTSHDWDSMVDEVFEAKKVLVVVAGDLTEVGLTDVPSEVAKLEWNHAPHGLIHLRSGVNSVGHDATGLVADWDEEMSSLYKQAWTTFNANSGKSYQELAQGGVKALLAVGCDPMAMEDSKKPSFLAVAASHPNKSTKKADLVLPLSTWVESHGVFVSTDGTVQFSRQAILPEGESKPAWSLAKSIISVLEEEEMELSSVRKVYAEMGRLNSNFAGATYKDFQQPGEVHWSYPQQADLGMPRPDLSAIPVRNPDAPMWMPTQSTGSEVEEAGRLHRGQTPPPVPRSKDPREVAALLGLSKNFNDDGSLSLSQTNIEKKDGYIPLRVVPSTGAQPAGPTPAKRHHEIGVGRRRQVQIPVAHTALLEAGETEAGDGAEEAGGDKE